MDEKNISQVELARMTNISKSGISQYRSGKVIPSMKYIEVIANALEVPIARFSSTREELHEEIKNVPVGVAAKRLGMSAGLVKDALKQGRAPFGFAVEGEDGKWRFHISAKRLDAYLT